jgi:hypothetical protein
MQRPFSIIDITTKPCHTLNIPLHSKADLHMKFHEDNSEFHSPPHKLRPLLTNAGIRGTYHCEASPHQCWFRIPHMPPAGSLKVLRAPACRGGIRRMLQTKIYNLKLMSFLATRHFQNNLGPLWQELLKFI